MVRFQAQQATTKQRSTMWFMGEYWFMVILSYALQCGSWGNIGLWSIYLMPWKSPPPGSISHIEISEATQNGLNGANPN